MGLCPRPVELTHADIVCAAAEIFAHTGKEGGRKGRQSRLPQRYHRFVASSHYSRNFSLALTMALYARSIALLWAHSGKTQRCQPPQGDTPALHRKQEQNFFPPAPIFCRYLRSISVAWPLVSASQYDSRTHRITVRRS